MPVKKDAAGRRWVEMELVVPGKPEQVWRAVATGPGYTAWFTPATIAERAGGAIRFDMGENGASTGEVTIWEPPSRFAFVERNWGENAPPLATEVTVTARSGDRCLVRMVHSLVASTDDWDEQLEGFEGGWPAFFKVLRLYLTHFANMNAAVAFAMTSVEAPQQDVWKRLTTKLKLASANVGEEWKPQTPEKLAGLIEHVEQDERQRYVLLRLGKPGPGIALIATYGFGSSTNVSMTFYFYGDDAEQRAAASGPVWQSWCKKTVSG